MLDIVRVKGHDNEINENIKGFDNNCIFPSDVVFSIEINWWRWASIPTDAQNQRHRQLREITEKQSLSETRRMQHVVISQNY
jgi:hypothetical protein